MFFFHLDQEQLLTRVMKKSDIDDKSAPEFFTRSLRSNHGQSIGSINLDRFRRFGNDYLARSLRSSNGADFLSRTMRGSGDDFLSRTMRGSGDDFLSRTMRGSGDDFLSRAMRSRNNKPSRSPSVANNYLIRAM
jgi:hypothetical protein